MANTITPVAARQIIFKGGNTQQGKHAYQKIKQHSAAHYGHRQAAAIVAIRAVRSEDKKAVGSGVQCFAKGHKD